MKIHFKMRNPGMKEFSVIFKYMLNGIHTKERPSKNERNPGMKDFSSISNEILKGIHKGKSIQK